ncbi:Oidioi.mRNA.OKI2018_I69.chr1.g1877.t1.cds [Oikopleura dioica]|uniref:Oidioi.mRNA.OKI2018_I69.chr1.g1877.t1.cds n=1 Tax=Oikopleura dioica TaxID=34765 RepID=A0ABN7SVJ8_OIKDI|nr:Oidioi.mRNA.OKI2018_I69.chr1.g1877.t1.cds [Oikopleura dioica]
MPTMSQLIEEIHRNKKDIESLNKQIHEQNQQHEEAMRSQREEFEVERYNFRGELAQVKKELHSEINIKMEQSQKRQKNTESAVDDILTDNLITSEDFHETIENLRKTIDTRLSSLEERLARIEAHNIQRARTDSERYNDLIARFDRQDQESARREEILFRHFGVNI